MTLKRFSIRVENKLSHGAHTALQIKADLFFFMFFDLILEYLNHVLLRSGVNLFNMAKRGSAPKSGSSLKSGPSSKSNLSRSGSSPPKNASASAGSDGAEPIPTSFEEINQLFVNERAERKILQGDFEKSQEDMLKVKKSHAAYAKFLVKPHLLNLANEILLLCKGWNKPSPTKNTFSALTGDRRTHFYTLITLLKL
jgi:hypothetical protein